MSALQGDDDQVFWVARRPRISAVKSLQGSLSVEERGDWSGILSITVTGTNPERVYEQVNEIANVYVRQNVERKSEEAQKTLEFLDEQLPIVRQNMEAAELALNSYRLEKGSIDLPLETQTVLQTIVSIEATDQSVAAGARENSAGVYRGASDCSRTRSTNRRTQRAAGRPQQPSA